MKIASEFKDFLKTQRKRLIILFSSAFFAAALSGALYTTVLRLIYGNWTFSARVLYSPDSLIRMLFFFVLYAFFGACLSFDRKKIFDYIFNHRWYFALGIFSVLVLLNINLSSVGAFDYFVQPDMKTDTTLAIFGLPRSIRSDEWLVNVPLNFTSDFAGFGEFNYIPRATENYSIAANGLKLGISALCSPMSWGYYLFGAERGLSFFWSFLIVMSFMASYEFSLIISKNSRRLALLGAGLIGFSQFSMWWSVCTYLISAQMLIVCAYYFFGEKRTGRKILYAIGAMFSATLFITKLYPAWQVPYGYILIGLIVWLVITRLREIKSSRWLDLVIIGSAFVIMAVLVLFYLRDKSEANKALLATVYPGKRFDTGGGGLFKAGAFLYTPLLPFKTVSVANNNSDASMFYSLFPLPIIFSVYSLVRQIIRKRRDKSRGIDVFNLAVLIPTLFLLIYASAGVPAWLAKYSLLSYSLGVRTADFLGLANVYLLIRNMANEGERVKFSHFAPVAALCAAFWIFCSYKTVPEYMPVWFCIISVAAALGLAFVAYSEAPAKIAHSAIVAASSLFLVLGLCVHPIMHGADALTEKPFANAVREEVAANPDAKWIGYENHIIGQYLIANGAPTINSTNYIPNLDFWHLFDPEGENEFIYNRYAHIAITFTDEETSMELFQSDYAGLHINFGDIKKTEVKYVASINGEIDFALSAEELLAKYSIEFKLIYSESNSCIYEVIYH